MISSVLTTIVIGKKDDSRKGFFMFNVAEDKELLVYAGLLVPIVR